MSQNRSIPSTTDGIWDYYYLASFPDLASRSFDDIRTFGVRVSGIKAIDDDAHNRWTTTMLTIDQMVEYYRQDVPIRICNYSDTKEIYGHISKHLQAWKTQLENGINIGEAPIEDLILLDTFANTVYEHAKYEFTTDYIETALANRLSGLQRINVQNFFTKRGWANVQSDGVLRINGTDEDKPADRDPLGEFFKTRLINFSGRP